MSIKKWLDGEYIDNAKVGPRKGHLCAVCAKINQRVNQVGNNWFVIDDRRKQSSECRHHG
jgi:hypothetical protein